MAREQNNKKRWRPRWSVRILLIAITLICAYLACWGPTKKYGVEDAVTRIYENVDSSHLGSAVVPLVVSVDNYEFTSPPDMVWIRYTRCYYFWFFGYVAKLPYERELPGTAHY